MLCASAKVPTNDILRKTWLHPIINTQPHSIAISAQLSALLLPRRHRFRQSNAAAATPASSAAPPLHVCVVGGGVVGLTSALRLLQRASAPGARSVKVTIIADKLGADTTTAGAAGLWGPYKLSDTPESLINRWGGDTYDHLMQLAHSPDADAAGVSLCSVNSLYPEPLPQLPFWKDRVYNFQLLDPRMLAAVSREDPDRGSTAAATPAAPPPPPPRSAAADAAAQSEVTAATAAGAGVAALRRRAPEPLPCRWGYHWNSVVCEGSRYLPWLTAQVEAAGGRLVRCPPLATLRDVAAAGAAAGAAPPDVVVNAAGLGARELLGDQQVYPIRGQILRVRAPWVRQAYFYEDFYIIPNRDTVVLGGTGQQGSSDLAPCPADRRRILDGCTRLLPSLAEAEVVADWVGLRPGRTRLRLELEPEGVVVGSGAGGGSEAAVPVVHNYGHGGAGLTLAWGCAGDVVRLLEEGGWLGGSGTA